MNKTLGKFGYWLREFLNGSRFVLLSLHDIIFLAIDWLDKKDSVSYWRKKDRGV